MTELLEETRFWTQPTTGREHDAWRAAIESLGRQHIAPQLMMSDVDVAVCHTDDLGHSSFASATEPRGGYDVDAVLYGGEPLPDGPEKPVNQWVEMHEAGHAHWQFAPEPLETNPLPEEVVNVYISFFEALRSRPQPDAIPEDEETVDWDFMASAPGSSRSGRIRVRLRNKGPARPRRDDSPWD